MNDLGDQLTEQFFPFNNSDKYRDTTTLEEGKKYLRAALKIFQPVQNVYKMIETYKILKTKINYETDPEELKSLVSDFAVYALEHGRSELALENLQHAYWLIDVIQRKNSKANLDVNSQQKARERKELAQRIGFTGL